LSIKTAIFCQTSFAPPIISNFAVPIIRVNANPYYFP
jgi:hypothetical protein